MEIFSAKCIGKFFYLGAAVNTGYITAFQNIDMISCINGKEGHKKITAVRIMATISAKFYVQCEC